MADIKTFVIPFVVLIRLFVLIYSTKSREAIERLW